MSMYDTAAEGIRYYGQQGAAIAEGQRQSGQIWGQTLASLGQLVGNLPGQIAQQKEAALRGQVTQYQLDHLKAAQAGQARANQIVGSLPKTPEGLIDTEGMAQQFAKAQVPLDQAEAFITSADKMNAIHRQTNQDKIDRLADVADLILSSHKAGEPITPDALHLGFASVKNMGLASDADEQKFTEMAASSNPEGLLKGIRRLSKKYADQDKPTFAPRESPGYMQDNQFHPLDTSAKNPTEWSVAMQAAGGDPVKALQLVHGEKAGSEWSAWQSAYARQALGKPDASWTDLSAAQQTAAIEKFKTIGPEASAAAAANRQASTQAAQVAQQARAQGFAESQAGRKEYTEKVAQPYQTALASAQTLRDTVAAAKSGNKVAANLQNLETAMAAIRAQGLNRINTTEIHVAADAGNLWDRVQSAFGKVVNGQPVDASLQKDILQFADILEKSATLKYQKGRDSIGQVYQGAKLPDESVSTGSAAAPAAPAASAPTEGATKPIPGYPGTEQTYRNGKWIRTK